MSAAMEEKRLAEIRERVEKATSGPWCWESVGDKSNEFVVGIGADSNGTIMTGQLPEGGDIEDAVIERRAMLGANESGMANFADADFIAHSRTDIPYLLEVVARLRELASAAQPPLPPFTEKHAQRIAHLFWPTNTTISEQQERMPAMVERVADYLKEYASAAQPVAPLPPVEVDDAFVEAVEDECGMGAGAWDAIDPKAICRAVLKLAAAAGVPSDGWVAPQDSVTDALLYDCILELSYIQSVENCHSGLCATPNGNQLIDRGMALLKLRGLWDNSLKAARDYEAKHPAQAQPEVKEGK